MPLHLLGKKSWNVYNADNIARVQRDQAAAAAEEHAAEQRMQDADAARRLAILRGESPPPPLPEEEQQPADPSDKKYLRRDRDRDGAWLGGPRKRKRAGEDDTDFEMRVARERAEEGAKVAGELGVGGQKERDGVGIVDSRGHIDLVGAPPKDDAGEQEGKTRGVADRNATGALKGEFADDPWYADAKRRRITSTAPSMALVPIDSTTTKDRDAERGMEAPTKNVWGRDDPKRRGRETARLDANDPLAAMKSGAKKVRDMAKERKRDAEERSRELEELRKEERRREKRRSERDHADEVRDGGENVEKSRRHSHHRSGRSERRHHGDERSESRHDHAHREERRRHRETEHTRERDQSRHHRRDRESSRERDRSSRSHRYEDKDDYPRHRERDVRRRDKEEA
ncbi:blastn match against entry EMBL [Diaporthe helianthi]|uniref:Blastn match against entry EMBL n=1 Tax=Diaporthe helianthi TaxID=158607 RepID=A0A2P5HSW8_DIAHE|nr:blastn match against entry EMBL [Diaporthe helianthi]